MKKSSTDQPVGGTLMNEDMPSLAPTSPERAGPTTDTSPGGLQIRPGIITPVVGRDGRELPSLRTPLQPRQRWLNRLNGRSYGGDLVVPVHMCSVALEEVLDAVRDSSTVPVLDHNR